MPKAISANLPSSTSHCTITPHHAAPRHCAVRYTRYTSSNTQCMHTMQHTVHAHGAFTLYMHTCTWETASASCNLDAISSSSSSAHLRLAATEPLNYEALTTTSSIKPPNPSSQNATATNPSRIPLIPSDTRSCHPIRYPRVSFTPLRLHQSKRSDQLCDGIRGGIHGGIRGGTRGGIRGGGMRAQESQVARDPHQIPVMGGWK